VRCAGVLSHFLFRRLFAWHQGFHDWEVVTGSPPGKPHSDHQYSAHTVTDQAIEWLDKPEKTAGRFWLWVHYMDPHKEYLSHRGIEKFGDDRRAMYDHEVRFTDHHVGRLLDHFYALPAAERTVVIVTSDHGEAFGEHGRMAHGRELWEEIIRVPLIVVGPGIAAKRIPRQTSHIDLFPTIVDLFGAAVPEGTHGQSLLPDWVDGQQVPVRPVIADQPKNPYYETRRIFIRNGWKLHHLPDTGNWRLFRITDDYERGDSLVETEPERFAEIRAAYELFLATEFAPRDPVKVVRKD
jgi:arylsulfatase A-like enzyme